MAKIYFQTYSRNKHESLQSKQQPIVDKSAEAPPAERVPLAAQQIGTRTATISHHWLLVVTDIVQTKFAKTNQ